MKKHSVVLMLSMLLGIAITPAVYASSHKYDNAQEKSNAVLRDNTKLSDSKLEDYRHQKLVDSQQKTASAEADDNYEHMLEEFYPDLAVPPKSTYQGWGLVSPKYAQPAMPNTAKEKLAIVINSVNNIVHMNIDGQFLGNVKHSQDMLEQLKKPEIRSVLVNSTLSYLQDIDAYLADNDVLLFLGDTGTTLLHNLVQTGMAAIKPRVQALQAIRYDYIQDKQEQKKIAAICQYTNTILLHMKKAVSNDIIKRHIIVPFFSWLTQYSTEATPPKS